MAVPYAEVIGDPVRHSKSPLIHNHWLKRAGMEARYVATRVAAGELGAYFADRRQDPDWRGCNVTLPHKIAVIEHLDSSLPCARRIGAVNTVINQDGRLTGANTDWQGVNLALFRSHRGEDVVLIGAGGGARAALEHLRHDKPRNVLIMTRSLDKTAGLLDRFSLPGSAVPLGPVPPADLLINASPLGMEGFPALDIDLARLRPGATVFDMVYRPIETLLLRAARARGLIVVDGLAMLVGQASMAFTHFFEEPPEPADTAELRELLAS